MVLTSVCLAVQLISGDGDPAGQDLVQKARQLLASGRTGDALELVEREATQSPADVELHRILGRGYLQLAAEWREAGSSPMPPLLDAQRVLDRALELDPDDPATLAMAHAVALELGDHVGAGSHARREIGATLLRDGRASPGSLDRAARARLMQLWQDNPTGLPQFAQEFSECHALLQHAIATAPDEPSLRLHAADLLQWVQLHALAAELVREGLRRTPDAVSLHQRLIDLHYYQGVVERLAPFYRELVERAPASGTVSWYRGYTELLLGDLARMEQRLSDSEESYRSCLEWMARAEALKPDYAESCDRIAFLASLGLGWSALRQGELARSAGLFQELLDRDPALHEMRDGLRRSLIDGIGLLQAEVISSRDFPAGLDLARRIAEVRDEASWWNNLGFMLREYASQVEAGAVPCDGDPREQGRAIFTDSWTSYQRASELAPDDARIVNDSALIQAYHLRTELPRALEMFEQAISNGTAQLVDMGENPPETTRFPIAQAVGDAFENLGFVSYHVDQDNKKAAGYFEQSLATRSGERPTVEAYLEAIHGEREPIADPFVESFGALGPLRSARAIVLWEPSFREGLARAKAENRPLFVYYRGAGTSERAGILDGLVTIPGYAAAFQDQICVIADSNRSTLVDRRTDGRWVPSPRHGTVTCAEHIRAAEEFLTWWKEQRTEADLPLPEEGFYYVMPDGTRYRPEAAPIPGPARITKTFQDMVGEIGEPRPDASLALLRRQLASLRAFDRVQAAERLLQTPGRPARDLLEELLFLPGTSGPARRALVQAVAGRDDDDARALLNALVHQDHDPALQLVAIESQARSDDLESLHHARTWAASVECRQAATRALGRLSAEDEDRRLLVAQLIAAPPGERAAAATALGSSAASQPVLLARLAIEDSGEVRAAICAALHGDRDPAVQRALETVSREDPDPLVRAAALRSLQDS